MTLRKLNKTNVRICHSIILSSACSGHSILVAVQTELKVIRIRHSDVDVINCSWLIIWIACQLVVGEVVIIGHWLSDGVSLWHRLLSNTGGSNWSEWIPPGHCSVSISDIQGHSNSNLIYFNEIYLSELNSWRCCFITCKIFQLKNITLTTKPIESSHPFL